MPLKDRQEYLDFGSVHIFFFELDCSSEGYRSFWVVPVNLAWVCGKVWWPKFSEALDISSFRGLGHCSCLQVHLKSRYRLSLLIEKIVLFTIIANSLFTHKPSYWLTNVAFKGFSENTSFGIRIWHPLLVTSSKTTLDMPLRSNTNCRSLECNSLIQIIPDFQMFRFSQWPQPE